jgi:hypothetical protein
MQMYCISFAMMLCSAHVLSQDGTLDYNEAATYSGTGYFCVSLIIISVNTELGERIFSMNTPLPSYRNRD